MEQPLMLALIAALASVLASTGFWTFLQTRREKKSLTRKMLLGLAHDRIIELCMDYIERDSITHDELENLLDYLYDPYEKMGGNGSAKRLVDIVKNLPVREYIPTWPEIERRKKCTFEIKNENGGE